MTMRTVRSHHFLRQLGRDEQHRLFSSVFIQSLGASLIGIFVPIYLLQQHFDIDSLALFYFWHFASCIPAVTIAMLINNRLGIKKSMLTGLLINVLGYVVLSQVHAFDATALLSAALLGAGGTIYHLGYHIELTRSMERNHEGSALSWLQILALIANLAGPLVGGLIIVNASFPILMGVVAVLMTLSMLPLLATADYRLPVRSFNPFDALSSGTIRLGSMYYVQGFIKTSYDIFWPAFIYLNYQNLVGIGGIVAVSSAIVIAATYYIGKLTDANNTRSLKTGVASHVGSWFLKLLLLSPIGILISNLFSTLAASMVETSVDRMVYKRASLNQDQAQFFMFREYHMLFGRMITLAIVALVANLTLLFIATALIGIVMLQAIPDIRQLENKTQST